MRWLLTVSSDTDLQSLTAALAELGCTLEDTVPVPLDNEELVLFADAPPDLQERLLDHKVPVSKASPASDYELY